MRDKLQFLSQKLTLIISKLPLPSCPDVKTSVDNVEKLELDLLLSSKHKNISRSFKKFQQLGSLRHELVKRNVFGKKIALELRFFFFKGNKN